MVLVEVHLVVVGQQVVSKIMRGGLMVRRLIHNQEVAGSIPAPATKFIGSDCSSYKTKRRSKQEVRVE